MTALEHSCVVCDQRQRDSLRERHRRALRSAAYWHRDNIGLAGYPIRDRAEAAHWLTRAGDFRRALAVAKALSS